MDKAVETLRDKIFTLDEASQAWLAQEIESRLAHSEHMQVWLEEVARRDKEWDAGFVSGIDASETIRKARELVRR